MSAVTVRLRVMLSVLVALLVLAGCSEGPEDLAAWEAKVRAETKPKLESLTPPKAFDPRNYAVQRQTDPFSTEKLQVALRQEKQQVTPLVEAEMKRRRQPLEIFPLDSITMVGSMNKLGQPYALVRADKMLYQVKKGDYLGMNFGKITDISETKVSLREIVQDAVGEWIERTSTLELQEQAK